MPSTVGGQITKINVYSCHVYANSKDNCYCVVQAISGDKTHFTPFISVILISLVILRLIWI